MRRLLALLSLFALSFLVFGCSDDQPLQIGAGDDDAAKARPGLIPGGFYSFAWSDADNGAYSGFELISKKNGLATPVWTLSGQLSWVVDPPSLWGPSPVGFAFDLDGSMYTIIGAYSFDETLAQSRFASIDPVTGAVTYIGDPVAWNYCGPDIDSHGNFYVCGMDVPHLGYIHGTGRLYTVNKATGVFAEIGPLDVEITDWMDLAFDSHDQLWGTTQNKLFKIDTATGAITDIIPILGVPGDPPPEPYTIMQEVMTIAFDDKDVLYGTAINVEWDTGHGAPVMKIDTVTGQTTQLGFTEKPYNHGGDIYPTKVTVAHRKGGGYQMITINIEALPAHLAHGDYVPGTVGDPNYPH